MNYKKLLYITCYIFLRQNTKHKWSYVFWKMNNCGIFSIQFIMIQTIISILGIGIGILVVAIFLNLLANYFGWSTWYDYLTSIQSNGWNETHKNTDWWSLLFMYVLYPFLLGLTAYLLYKWLLIS